MALPTCGDTEGGLVDEVGASPVDLLGGRGMREGLFERESGIPPRERVALAWGRAEGG